MPDKEITLPLPADGTREGEHITEVIGNQERLLPRYRFLDTHQSEQDS